MTTIPYRKEYIKLDGTLVTDIKRDALGYALDINGKIVTTNTQTPQYFTPDTYALLETIAMSVPDSISNTDTIQKLSVLRMQVEKARDVASRLGKPVDVRLTDGIYTFLFALADKKVPLNAEAKEYNRKEKEANGDKGVFIEERTVGQHIFGNSWDLVLHALRGTEPKDDGVDELWKDIEEILAKEAV